MKNLSLKKNVKMVLAMLLACVMVVSICSDVIIAKERNSTTSFEDGMVLLDEFTFTSNDEGIMPLSGLDGYGAAWNKSSGTFIVPTTGSSKNRGYITIRIEDPSQNDTVQFSITGPDHGQSGIWSTKPKNGAEQKYTFTTAPVGNYTVWFKSLQGQKITFHCWIYG